jgi:hypothetical protein
MLYAVAGYVSLWKAYGRNGVRKISLTYFNYICFANLNPTDIGLFPSIILVP